MNKVFTVNLGGIPFTIDEDAFEYLDKYLKAIHKHFRGGEGYEEITGDIEARLAELFQESLGSRPIVTLKDAKDAITVMGQPEEFGADPLEDEGEESSAKRSDKKSFNIKTGKRLFRDPEEEVVAGVCSGIAAYFGISDPLWVRLGFIVFSFLGGSAMLIYGVLWAILPKAETAGDYLAMKGEPINVDSISKTIKEEFDNISETLSDFGEGLGENFGSKKKKAAEKRESDGRNALEEGISILGHVIQTVILTLLKVIPPIFKAVGIILIVVLVLMWIAMVTGMFYSSPYFNFILPHQGLYSHLAIFNIFMIAGIPLFLIAMSIIRAFFGAKLSTSWKIALGVFWGINAVGLGLAGTFIAKEFKFVTEVTKQDQTLDLTSDTLEISMLFNDYSSSFVMAENEIRFVDDKLVIENVDIALLEGEGSDFKLVQVNRGRGASRADAEQLTDNMGLQYTLEGNHLKILPEIEIQKGNQWRAQEVNLTLYVPKGKAIKIGKEVNHYFGDVERKDDNYRIWHNRDKTWIMEDGGLMCVNCEE